MNQGVLFGGMWQGAFGRGFGLVSGRARLRKPLFALLAALLFNSVVIAQQQSPGTLHVETRLVQVRVKVADRHGNPVVGLTKSDFAVKEDGHPQQVSILNYIPVVTPRPRTPRESRGQKPAGLTGPPEGAAAPRVWIYIDTEVDSTEIPRTYLAIRKFLTDQFEPGFMVSIDGQPFSNNRAQLLATLEEMRQHPHGRSPDIPSLLATTLYMEKQADYEWLNYSAMLTAADSRRGMLFPPPGRARLILRSRGAGSNGEIEEEIAMTEREMRFYVREALFRYLDIIRSMEALQGQKVVVVFRSGLRMDPDSTELLHRFSADAMRQRVAFYTVDSRGLLTINPSENQEMLMRYGVPSPPPGLANRRYLAALDDYSRTQELVAGRKDGLIDTARLTGGQAVTNTNDLDMVFNHVVQDSSGYYDLGYYTADRRQRGAFRRVAITVDRPGATVYAPKGYYEPLPFNKLSKKDKEIGLWSALESQTPQDLPVTTSVSVFRDDEGQPVAVVSAGVRIGALTAKQEGKLSGLRTAALSEIRAGGSGTPPIYRGRYATVPMPRDSFRRAQADPTVYLTYNWTIPVSPGKHTCKVIFRDENTGKLGASEVKFDAPDYGAAATTSSLLVTREATPVQTQNTPNGRQSQPVNSPRLLEASDLNLVPEPDSAFLVGDEVYLLFDLYNPPSYDDKAVADFARSLTLQILRNGAPMGDLDIDWRISADGKRKIISVLGSFSTSGFKPGNYQMIETIPMGTSQAPQKLLGAFSLLPTADIHISRRN